MDSAIRATDLLGIWVCAKKRLVASPVDLLAFDLMGTVIMYRCRSVDLVFLSLCERHSSRVSPASIRPDQGM
jgi:hypothetical protein